MAKVGSEMNKIEESHADSKGNVSLNNQTDDPPFTESLKNRPTLKKIDLGIESIFSSNETMEIKNDKKR